MLNPLFSIIIPAYNTEKYIVRCLDSVMEQVFLNYEIIVVNDGSTDQTKALVDEYAEKYRETKILIISQSNQGLSASRNTGLENATGEYVIWLDSDDALAPDALIQLSKHTLNKPDVIVNRISSYSLENGQIKECSYRFMNSEADHLNMITEIFSLKGFWFSAWCFVVNRNFLKKNNIKFKVGILHEDELWSPYVLVAGERFSCNNYCYYLNTKARPYSIKSEPNINKSFDNMEIVKILNTTGKKGIDKRFIERRILVLLYTVFSTLNEYKKNKRYRELKKEFKNTMYSIYRMKMPGILILYSAKRTLETLNGKLKKYEYKR